MADIATKYDLRAALETQTRRMTMRLGAMLVASFGMMTAVIGMLLKFH